MNFDILVNWVIIILQSFLDEPLLMFQMADNAIAMLKAQKVKEYLEKEVVPVLTEVRIYFFLFVYCFSVE